MIRGTIASFLCFSLVAASFLNLSADILQESEAVFQALAETAAEIKDSQQKITVLSSQIENRINIFSSHRQSFKEQLNASNRKKEGVIASLREEVKGKVAQISSLNNLKTDLEVELKRVEDVLLLRNAEIEALQVEMEKIQDLSSQKMQQVFSQLQQIKDDHTTLIVQREELQNLVALLDTQLQEFSEEDNTMIVQMESNLDQNDSE